LSETQLTQLLVPRASAAFPHSEPFPTDSDGGWRNAKEGTPDRSKLFGSHGQRSWI